MDTIEKLKILVSNAKKSIGKPYSRETIEKKKLEVTNLEKDLQKNLLQNSGTEEEKQELQEQFKKFRLEFLGILDQHLSLGILENKEDVDQNLNSGILENTDTMATATVMDTKELLSIAKLIPIFTGKKDELNNFITNLELIDETISSSKKESFFKFVFKSRLDPKVQNRIKHDSVPANITDLIAALKKCYKPIKCANNILNEVTRLVQKGDNVRGFADKIESLIADLNEVQISEVGETHRASIVRTNNTIAFNTFKNGLKDPQIISTIDASRVKTFSEALQIAESSQIRTTQRQIFHQSTSRGHFNNIQNRWGDRYGNNMNQSGNHGNTRFSGNRGSSNNSGNYRGNITSYNRGNFNNSENRRQNNNNFRGNNYMGRFSQNNSYRGTGFRGVSSYQNNYRGNTRNRFFNNSTNRNYNINQIENQGNFQEPEMAQQESPEITQ